MKPKALTRNNSKLKKYPDGYNDPNTMDRIFDLTIKAGESIGTGKSKGKIEFTSTFGEQVEIEKLH